MIKIIGCIQARADSKRFPLKVLRRLGDKTLIEWAMETAQLCECDDICVLTSARNCDKDIIDLAEGNNIKGFGFGNDVNDVIFRYKQLNNLYKYKYERYFFLRICADSPFIDIELTKQLIKRLKEEKNETYLYYSYLINNKPVILTGYGIFAELFDPIGLNIDSNFTDYEKEHVTPNLYLRHRTDCWFFDVPEIIKNNPFSISIDYPYDLERCKKILKMVGRRPNYKDIISCINLDSDLKKEAEMIRYWWDK